MVSIIFFAVLFVASVCLFVKSAIILLRKHSGYGKDKKYQAKGDMGASIVLLGFCFFISYLGYEGKKEQEQRIVSEAKHDAFMKKYLGDSSPEIYSLKAKKPSYCYKCN